jgi:hypothetical protein
MNLPYRWPGEKFVAFATREKDNSLKHDDCRAAAVRTMPNIGLATNGEKVSEVLTDDALLEQRSLRLHLPIAAVVVLAHCDA